MGSSSRSLTIATMLAVGALGGFAPVGPAFNEAAPTRTTRRYRTGLSPAKRLLERQRQRRLKGN